MQKAVRRGISAVQAGFSLIEIIVAIVLVGLLAAFMARNFLGFGETGREKLVRSELISLKSAIELYKLKIGQYPEQLEDLVEEPSDPNIAKKWSPMLESLPRNPWNIDYEYQRLAVPGKAHKGRPFELTTENEDGTKQFSVWDE